MQFAVVQLWVSLFGVETMLFVGYKCQTVVLAVTFGISNRRSNLLPIDDLDGRFW